MIERFSHLPAEALYIRITVFTEEQGLLDKADDIDKTAVHLVAYDADRTPIGTCRVFVQDRRCIVGRLCVLKDRRGQGIGKALLREAEQCAGDCGAEALWLHSQLQAAAFYERLGYAAEGETEYEQGCPHIWMVKRW